MPRRMGNNNNNNNNNNKAIHFVTLSTTFFNFMSNFIEILCLFLELILSLTYISKLSVWSAYYFVLRPLPSSTVRHCSPRHCVCVCVWSRGCSNSFTYMAPFTYLISWIVRSVLCRHDWRYFTKLSSLIFLLRMWKWQSERASLWSKYALRTYAVNGRTSRIWEYRKMHFTGLVRECWRILNNRCLPLTKLILWL